MSKGRMVCDSPKTRRAGMKYLLGAAAATLGSVLALKQAHAGTTWCYYCQCPAFLGSQTRCGNCGHTYSQHY